MHRRCFLRCQCTNLEASQRGYPRPKPYVPMHKLSKALESEGLKVLAYPFPWNKKHIRQPEASGKLGIVPVSPDPCAEDFLKPSCPQTRGNPRRALQIRRWRSSCYISRCRTPLRQWTRSSSTRRTFSIAVDNHRNTMRPSRYAEDAFSVATPPEIYNWRVYVLACVASFGAMIFGYDLAFIGTTLALPSFKKAFHLSGNEDAFSANIVSLLQAGCFFGSLIAGPLGDKIGRRWALICSGVVFCVGSILQTCSFGSVPAMFTGRAIGGLVSWFGASTDFH